MVQLHEFSWLHFPYGKRKDTIGILPPGAVDEIKYFCNMFRIKIVPDA